MMSPIRSLVAAGRAWRGSAGPTALIVLTLSVALGANSAVISLVDALLIRAVPFERPDELMVVSSGFPNIKLTGMGLSGPEAEELRTFARAFREVGPLAFASLTAEASGQDELVSAVRISKGAWSALQLRPVGGAGLGTPDFAGAGAPVVVVGHHYWTRALGARPVVGRTIRVEGAVREIVGVAPPNLTLLNRQVDLWLPIGQETLTAGGRADHGFTVIGRLLPGFNLSRANDDLRRAMATWQVETGELHSPTERTHPLEARALGFVTTGVNREPAGALVAAVAFLLLLACANVSNLMVARVERRRAELAVRLALGASRRRLLADAAIDGVALAGIAAIGGLLIAHLLIRGAIGMWPVASTLAPVLDYRVIGVTAVLAGLAGLITSAVPILRLNTSRAGEWLRTAARGSSAPGRQHLQHALVALQVALAVLLSATSGLMVRSLWHLTAIDTGLNPERVLRAQVALSQRNYSDDAAVWSFYERALERARSIPGVSGAAVISGLPPLRRANNTSFLLDGNVAMNHESIRQVDFIQHVSPGYAGVLGMRVTEGRDLLFTDHERSAAAALVNETLASRFWPGQSPVGRQLKPALDGPWFTVVGVVRDVRQAGLHEPPGAEVFVTHRQARMLLPGFLPRAMSLVVKTTADPESISSVLASEIRQAGPSVAVSDVMPLQAVIDRTIAQPRMLAWAFGGFAALSLLVAAIGVYAVAVFASNARTREFGVRLALGAQRADIMRLVTRSTALSIAIGVVAGVAGTLLGTRLVRNLLFGIAPLDPASLLSGVAVMSVAAALAVAVPAMRAARVDPVRSLSD